MALTAARPVDRDTTTGPSSACPVLVGFADALAAPETSWSLLESGQPVVAFARRGSRPPLRRCQSVRIVEITAPEKDVGQALADLRALAKADELRAAMPLDDAAVWLCNAAFGHSSVTVAGPTGARAELALDKRLQLEAAQLAGLHVPPTRCLETTRDLLALSEFPVVLKPARPVANDGGRLVRGANYTCGTREELAAAARAWNGAGPLLAQPLLRGVGEGLFGLSGPDGLRALSAHRRIRMMNPAGSGSSACSSSRVDEDLSRAAARMLSNVGWTGMFMLEFLRAPDGTAWFIELNGRPWGSMALARRLGFEYPVWAIRQLEEDGFDPSPPPAREGLTCRHLGRELVHLLMVFRGPASVATTQWPSRWRTVRDVLRFSRDDYWYNLRPDDRRLFVEDAVGTVLGRIMARVRI